MSSISSWSSPDSDESYTSHLLAKIKADQEHFDRTISFWELLHSQPTSTSTCFGNTPPVPTGQYRYRQTPVLHMSTQRHQYRSEPSMAYEPRSPPWVMHRSRTPERPRRKWYSPFKDMWHSILICLGLKRQRPGLKDIRDALNV